MGGLVRLLVIFGKFAVTIILIAVVLYATFFLLNRVFRFFVDAMGYEALDMWTWTKSKFKLKKKEAVDVEKPESREIV